MAAGPPACSPRRDRIPPPKGFRSPRVRHTVPTRCPSLRSKS
jgi:hypothetical protein